MQNLIARQNREKETLQTYAVQVTDASRCSRTGGMVCTVGRLFLVATVRVSWHQAALASICQPIAL